MEAYDYTCLPVYEESFPICPAYCYGTDVQSTSH